MDLLVRDAKAQEDGQAKFIETYISDELKKAIDGSEWLSPTHPFRYRNHTRAYLGGEVY
ncbi:MAG: hypothetical protein WB992_02470 [Bryobacteraceae bacterium]